jgi:alkylation response protein AidB-like acyl-CoA dehydrogenase
VHRWSDEQLAVSAVVRRFVDEEIRPVLDDLEYGDLPPYGILRTFASTFGLDELARERFKRRLEREASGTPRSSGAGGSDAGTMLLAIIELCRVSPGLVTSFGVSIGLAGETIMKLGTTEQKERFALDLLTFEKVGSWALTEPDSGSDALGGMRTTARREAGGYVLNGQKTWITNGPYADTIVCYAKVDDGSGTDPRLRQVIPLVLSAEMEGLTRSKPMRKMGQHASPTGDLFFSDVFVADDRVLGTGRSGGRESAKDNFVTERAGVAAMSLGIIEECLRLSVEYAKTRTLWDRPISEFQLIQLKLARMEVARVNVQNLVFMHLERTAEGVTPTLAEASAMKLYAAQAAFDVANEAIQLFGGNGYISEYRVEQLARDARVLQIYAGTDEIQVVAIAKDLLSR